MADGYIEIDTELATDKFDRQVMALQRKIEKLEKKDVEITANTEGLKKSIQNYEDLGKKVDEARAKVQQLEQMPKEVGSVPAGPYLQELRQARLERDQLLVAQVKEQTAMEQARAKLSSINAQHQEIRAEVETYASKIRQIRLDQHAKEVDRVKSGFKGVGTSIQDAVRKAGRLVLGIFAIRSINLYQIEPVDFSFSNFINFNLFAIFCFSFNKISSEKEITDVFLNAGKFLDFSVNI